MKLKKCLSALLGAAVTVNALALSLSAEEIKYHCQWQDVRPESNYEITFKNVIVDGQEKCKLILSGIPVDIADEEKYNRKYEIKDGDITTETTIKYGGIMFYIDMDGGKGKLRLDLNKNEGVTSWVIMEMQSPTTEPDENGEYCFVKEYLNSQTTSYDPEGAKCYKDENNEYCLEVYVNSNNKYFKSLMESKSTTVYAVGQLWVKGYSYGNGGGVGGSKRVNFGVLSDGSLITGDGKYIDCCTGKEIASELSEDEYEYAVDSLTEIPKETVKINVIEGVTEETTAPETTAPEETTDETTAPEEITEESTAPEETTNESAVPDNTASSEAAVTDKTEDVPNTTAAAENTAAAQNTTAAEVSGNSGSATGTEQSNVLINEENGISVSGNIGENISLNVTKGEVNETSAVFNISLVDKDGNAVQPDGTVEVTIPVPDGLKAENCKVYREEEDGTFTNMKAKLENGYLVFSTEHFSKYVVSTVPLDDGNQATGTAIAIAPVVIAALGAAAARKRK